MSHLLFISHARGVHGAEAVMVQAIRACVAGGARVTVTVPSIVADSGLDAVLEGIPKVRVVAFPYRAAGVHLWRTALVRLYNLPALWRLHKLLRKDKADCICSSSSITLIGADLARFTRTRHVWHWHELADSSFGWHPSMKGLYRRLAQRTDTIIFIAKQQQKIWEDTLGRPFPNAQVVYNPIKRMDATQTNGLAPHKGVRIGFIGHFEARKNIGLLVSAFEKIHPQHPDASLWLCGAITEEDKNRINEMTGLREPTVVVFPQTPKVSQFYGEIDLLVLPSWRETMPLVVIEAMQLGVCVLQTDQSCMKEILKDGIETLFFSPYQPDALLSLLEKCMHADFRGGIASAGQKKALQLVNKQSFENQMQTILCES